MQRHLIDQPRGNSNTRLREFTRQERQSGLHPSVLALLARPKARTGENRKVVEFARILRGRLS